MFSPRITIALLLLGFSGSPAAEAAHGFCAYMLENVPWPSLEIEVLSPVDQASPTLFKASRLQADGSSLITRVGVKHGQLRAFALPAGARFAEGADRDTPYLYSRAVLHFDRGSFAEQSRETVFYPLSKNIAPYRALRESRDDNAEIYLRDGVLQRPDWNAFMDADERLEARRLVHLMIRDRATGRRLAYLRMIDGSPSPGLMAGAYFDFLPRPRPTAPTTRLAQRFPGLPLEKFAGPFGDIYEFTFYFIAPGLDWDPRPLLLKVLQPYFFRKYGVPGEVPPEIMNGIIVLETPGARWRLYARPVNRGGYGFHELALIDNSAPAASQIKLAPLSPTDRRRITRENLEGVMYMPLAEFLDLPDRLLAHGQAPTETQSPK